uniref:Uncharacterized protein n=1 Tax=Cyprinus carpio TaxID=7962 RepID=A0A8C2HLV9_CYPCA
KCLIIIIKKRQQVLSCSGQRRDYPLSSLLDGYQCARQDEHISYGASAAPVPPFGCTFSSAPGQQNSLAVANEEGFVTIFNTGEKQSSVLKEWQAHDNAVFDIAWVPGANSLVSFAQFLYLDIPVYVLGLHTCSWGPPVLKASRLVRIQC